MDRPGFSGHYSVSRSREFDPCCRILLLNSADATLPAQMIRNGQVLAITRRNLHGQAWVFGALLVAVGTAVADRPRTDPYVQSYRIRLLPKVRDAKKRSSGYGCRTRHGGTYLRVRRLNRTQL